MCGATWPNLRVHDAFPEVSQKCSRCGADVDCALHTFWECPANDNIPSEAIQNTRRLKEHAIVKSQEEPCLWLRGLLPAHYTRVEPEYLPRNDIRVVSTNIERIDWVSFKTGTFYGDASGGMFSSMPRIRRIGCGIIQISNDGQLIWGQHFNLPGKIQTVPRGELFVLLYLAERLEPFSVITYVTDNQKVSDKFNEGRDAALQSTNCDLFKQLFNLIQAHNLSVTVRWMPCHLKPDDRRPEAVTEPDVIGNAFAEAQAGEAAKQHAVPVNGSSTHLYYI